MPFLPELHWSPHINCSDSSWSNFSKIPVTLPSIILHFLPCVHLFSPHSLRREMIPFSNPLPSGLLTQDDLAPLGSSPGRWVQKAVLYPVLVQVQFVTMSEQHWYQEILLSAKSFPINAIPFELLSYDSRSFCPAS